MPKLTRMRLVSIGHPRARFDDLLLDFRDQQHRATDTVIWLRNGGGKSSLLNLFYSVVRPRQTDFLGGKGGEEHRRLADYVQANDQAVVVCEWELDGDDALFAGEPLRYLTVAFHEHKSSSPTDGSNIGLQRLFLAAEVNARCAGSHARRIAPHHTGRRRAGYATQSCKLPPILAKPSVGTSRLRRISDRQAGRLGSAIGEPRHQYAAFWISA